MRGGRALSRRILPLSLLALLAVPLASAAPPVPGPRRYLVFPFENLSGEKSLNWLGEAIAMSLSDRLEALGMRTISRPERLDALDAASLPASGTVSLASSLRVAELARASRIVTGAFDYDPNDGVMVSARLLDLEGARQIWEGRRPGTLAGIFGLMDPLALEAAERDDRRMGRAEPSALAAIRDPALPLYEVIVRGLQEPEADRRVAALERGLEMNSRAPALLRALAFALWEAGRGADALARLDGLGDATFPDAWRTDLLRARILHSQGNAEGAVAAAARSIAEGDSADAHLLLARIHAGRGDRPRASAEIEIAAGLDAGHPDLADVRALLESGLP